MSSVTNLLLHIPDLENEVEKIYEVNRFFEEREIKPLISLDDPGLPEGWYGGSKMLECNLYAGAFNNFPMQDFIQHLKSLQWEDPKCLQIIFKGQNDDFFRITPIF